VRRIALVRTAAGLSAIETAFLELQPTLAAAPLKPAAGAAAIANSISASTCVGSIACRIADIMGLRVNHQNVAEVTVRWPLQERDRT